MSHDMTGYAPREEHVMRHDPAGAAIVIMMRSLKMPGMAQAVQDLHEQGSPAFDAAIPMSVSYTHLTLPTTPYV